MICRRGLEGFVCKCGFQMTVTSVGVTHYLARSKGLERWRTVPKGALMVL